MRQTIVLVDVLMLVAFKEGELVPIGRYYNCNIPSIMYFLYFNNPEKEGPSRTSGGSTNISFLFYGPV